MCALNNVCLTGNCEFCEQKGDCILYAILQKVLNLESLLREISDHAT
jgi:hypothetical protein